jgi:hypothetical protein
MENGEVVSPDPKLYDSPASTLRTFYYEPKTSTNKIRDDARHLLVAIRHSGKSGNALRLLSWMLVDASKIPGASKPNSRPRTTTCIARKTSSGAIRAQWGMRNAKWWGAQRPRAARDFFQFRIPNFAFVPQARSPFAPQARYQRFVGCPPAGT